MMQQSNKRGAVYFAAINKYVQDNMVLPIEKKTSGSAMIEWGERNLYPYYIQDLYNSVPSLRSIINGNVDFIAGDDCAILPLQNWGAGIMNGRGDTIREQVRDIALDYEKYGGFALQIIRNIAGEVSEVYFIDLRFLRANKECDVFYYCEDWKASAGKRKIFEYPAFMKIDNWAMLTDEQKNRHASSILFVKTTHTQTYPAPLYAAAVQDCEIERNITEFHLNSIQNGFSSNMVVNMNNGQPTDEMQEEMERNFSEKFCGQQNAGRVILCWNEDAAHRTTFESPKVEDFGERYNALSTHSRQQIFASFRAIPALFGIMTESTGFNEQEFSQAFRLYNRTQIRPVQRLICDAYDKIYGLGGVLTIKPFSIEEETQATDTNVN